MPSLEGFRVLSKRCSKCGDTKPILEFYKNRSQPDGHHNWCKPCFKAGCAAYQAKPHVKARRDMQAKAREPFRTDRAYSRERILRTKFNLTEERFNEMLTAQNGLCAVCGTDTPKGQGTWHVDHDRACCSGEKSCGKCIRGLLCSRCNPMLGMAKDSVETLRAAIDYLSRTSAVA